MMRNFWRHLEVFVCYAVLLAFSLWFAYELRFDFNFKNGDGPGWISAGRLQVLWIVPMELLLLYVFGQFRGFLSYFRLPDLMRIGTVFAIASGVILLTWAVFNYSQLIPRLTQTAPPFSVIILNGMLGTLSLAAFRLSLRAYREGKPTGQARNGSTKLRWRLWARARSARRWRRICSPSAAWA
jgi:FlaA1/EpsC-like NDP-sugar epimerase